MHTGTWREKRCHWQAYVEHKETLVLSTSHIEDNVIDETAKGSVSQDLRNRAYNTLKGVNQFPEATSKMLIIPSVAPLAIYFPSGL